MSRKRLPKGSYSPEYERAQEFLDTYILNKAPELGALAGSSFGPLGTAVGTGLGELFDWSVNTIFEDQYENKDKYIQGKWYKYDPTTGQHVPVSQEELNRRAIIPPGAKFVQDPRWRSQIPEISPLRETPVLPLTPIAALEAKEDAGFNINNYNPAIAHVPIFNDHRKYAQVHPSSRPSFNAAIPSSPQGFYRPRNY